MVVTGDRQLGFQFVFIQRFILFEKECVCCQEGRGCDAQQGGRGGYEQDVAASVVDFVQGGKTL